MRLEFRNVSFRYTELTDAESPPQLQNISFRFEHAEALGIVGSGGAGKTTLLQLITGLEKPYSGTVLANDEDIHRKNFSLTRLRQKVGLVFQFPESQLFEVTVGEDVAFGPRNLGLRENEIQHRTEEALQAMELPTSHFFTRDIHHLSQGEKRRVAIAGVLAMQPEVLVLDEPTAGLDPHAARQLIAILQKLRSDHGHGLIVVSHDIEFLAEIIDRVIVLEHGRLVLDFRLCDLAAMEDRLPANVPLPRPLRLSRHLQTLGIALPAPALTKVNLLHTLEKFLESA